MKYVLTYRLKNGDSHSEIWDSGSPLSIGHPFQWVLESTDGGVRIRNVSAPLNEVQSQSMIEATHQQTKNGHDVALPLSKGQDHPGFKLNIRLANTVPAGFEVVSKESRSGVLQVYGCVGPYIRESVALENTYVAQHGGVKLFNIYKKGSQIKIHAYADGIQVNGDTDNYELRQGEPVQLDVDTLEQTELVLGTLVWRFGFGNAPKVRGLTDAERRRRDPETVVLRRAVRNTGAITAFLLLIILLLPRTEKEEEKDVIPPQYAQVLMTPKKVGPAPEAAPAKSEKEEKETTKEVQKSQVVQSFRNKALQAEVSSLLKGGMTALLAQSDFVAGARNQHKARSMFNGIQLANLPVQGGFSKGREVQVASLGSSGGVDGGVGYGKGKRAGVSGQGGDFVDLDTGGAVTSEGLTKDEIGKVIHAHRNEIRYCYEASMQRFPDIEGKLTVAFNIGKMGLVTQSGVRQSTLADASLNDCILRRLGRWLFPKPKGGVNVAVTYPFIFKSIGR